MNLEITSIACITSDGALLATIDSYYDVIDKLLRFMLPLFAERSEYDIGSLCMFASIG